jgi:hypothetical protein
MLREGASSATSFIPLMFKEFLAAELRIIETNGLIVHSKAAMVHIDKFNVKGLRFISELLFPVNPQIILNFRIAILNETFDLNGTINWSQYESNMNLYEVVLIKDEQTKAKLITLFNSLTRQYMPFQLRAEYYYKYFIGSACDFNNSRINFLM